MSKQEQITRLHATAAYYETTGSWYMAEIFRGFIAAIQEEM